MFLCSVALENLDQQTALAGAEGVDANRKIIIVAENEIDAISSATITTKAVTNAVNGGLRVALELMEGGAVNE